MTTVFPHHYKAALNWSSGPTAALSAAPRPEILGGKPPQFDGSDAWWSPEHLLLSAAALCLFETYRSLSERAGIRTLSYRCAVEGTLDRIESVFAFTEIRLKVELETAPADSERARRSLESAKRHCIVANSLKTPVVLEIAGSAAEASP